MEGITATVEERAEYISDKHDVPLRAGYALQLAEVGFSNSGIAAELGVSESTVNSYQRKLEAKLGEKVWWPVTPQKPKLDVFPSRDPDREERPYSGDVVEIRPSMDMRDLPLNKGKPLSEIDLDVMY